MSEKATFEISFRVWHPKATVSDLCDRLGMRATYSQDIGSQRSTPAGKPLAGKYTETYCVFEVETPSGERLADLLWRHLGPLEERTSALRQIHSEGGRSEYFVAWFLNSNAGDTFRPDLMKRLGDLGVHLSFDLYPPNRS